VSLQGPFDELRVGASHRSHGRTLTEVDLAAFAALTGDMHPLHVDAEWAARSSFGRRIAHGLLVLSYAVGLAALDHDRMHALRAVSEAGFTRPVGIGDTIHVCASILRLRPVDAATGLVVSLFEVRNQDAELCARAEVELLWRREVAADPTGPP
jgi:acyl dehydratase